MYKKLLEVYTPDSKQSGPEAEIVKQYHAVLSTREELVGAATQFIIPAKTDDGGFTPVFDPAHALDIERLYKQIAEIEQRIKNLKAQIAALDIEYEAVCKEFGWDRCSWGELLSARKSMQAEVKRVQIVPAALKLKQKKFAEIEAAIGITQSLLKAAA